jgi:hypothetical protein
VARAEALAQFNASNFGSNDPVGRFFNSFFDKASATLKGMECLANRACSAQIAVSAATNPIDTLEAVKDGLLNKEYCGWDKKAECAGAFAFDALTILLTGGAAKPASARTGTNLADDAARSLTDDAAAGVPPNMHHTVPTEILRRLPDDVANSPLVKGRAGAPNRWAIPEDLHKAIHKGAGGGAYNEAWKDALASLGRDPTVYDVLVLREQITKQFGIDVFRP